MFLLETENNISVITKNNTTLRWVESVIFISSVLINKIIIF